MIVDQTITVQRAVETKNTRGQVTKTFSTAYTLRASVQPAGLSQDQALAFGISDLSANAKKVYLYKSGIIISDRIIADGVTYDVRGINPWPIHDEIIMVPLQGV
jgi:head-tail adaptor